MEKRTNSMALACVRYLRRVNLHRRLARRECKKLGIPDRGRRHDLSKYRLDEFLPYARKFFLLEQTNEINQAFIEAVDRHHRRNSHHHEWWEYNCYPLEASREAQLEMVADWRAMWLEKDPEGHPGDWYFENYEKLRLPIGVRRYIEHYIGIGRGELFGFLGERGEILEIGEEKKEIRIVGHTYSCTVTISRQYHYQEFYRGRPTPLSGVHR